MRDPARAQPPWPRAGWWGGLAPPVPPTQLVAVTGQGLGSVGRHLRVLLDAGLVERRRAGRSVLYSRTTAGQVLVEATEATEARDRPVTRRS